MRQFIVSDLHGNGNVYHSIMYYLEKINDEEPVILYINGDLIDRGCDSAELLLDVRKRIYNGPFKIIYLAGNHEALMYQTLQRRKQGKSTTFDQWLDEGGWRTDYDLEEYLTPEEVIYDLGDFIANLKVYHKFVEKMDGKNMVLVHASCPPVVRDECDMFLKEEIRSKYSLWAREDAPYFNTMRRIGNKRYFSIVGHTPNSSPFGFMYHENGNYLNIDGGSGLYVSGTFEYDHVPLLEVFDGYLKILTFNNNNEIKYGNYFKNGVTIPMSEDELMIDRQYLNKDFKPKRLIKNEDNVVYYKED